MKDRVATLLVATIAALLVAIVNPLSLPNAPVKHSDVSISRRSALLTVGGMLTGGAFLNPPSAWAAPDCFKDCLKNCKLIAPKDPEYCKASCDEYCAQEDRADGLSGSTSAASGEVGILGGTFGQGTVPKGEDKRVTHVASNTRTDLIKPPTIGLPGLDFSSEKGRKLIGY